MVGEPVECADHVGEHVGVEARVDLGGPREQDVLAEPMRQGVDVGEVPCGSPIKQGKQLVTGEFFRASVGPAGVAEAGRSGGAFTARSTRTPASALRMTIRQNVSLSWIRCADQPRCRAAASRASRGGNMPALGGGEEVEVFSGPCREVLCEQGRSACQQEALTGRQGEEQPGHLQLESRQIRLAAARRHYASACRRTAPSTGMPKSVTTSSARSLPSASQSRTSARSRSPLCSDSRASKLSRSAITNVCTNCDWIDGNGKLEGTALR